MSASPEQMLDRIRVLEQEIAEWRSCRWAKIYRYMNDYIEDSDQMGKYYNYIRACKNEDEWKDAGLPAKEASNRHTWDE